MEGIVLRADDEENKGYLHAPISFTKANQPVSKCMEHRRWGIRASN